MSHHTVSLDTSPYNPPSDLFDNYVLGSKMNIKQIFFIIFILLYVIILYFHILTITVKKEKNY